MRRKNETEEAYKARSLKYQSNMRRRAIEKQKSKPPKVRKPIAKKTKLRKKGKSASSKAKDRIQDLLRLAAIKRDGGCVLRNYPIAGRCGPEKADGSLVLQAEHLNGRANSVSYGDMDNIVCICLNHHIFFKKRNPGLYFLLIEEIVGSERWKKIEGWMRDKSPHPMRARDWAEKEEQLKALTNH